MNDATMMMMLASLYEKFPPSMPEESAAYNAIFAQRRMRGVDHRATTSPDILPCADKTRDANNADHFLARLELILAADAPSTV